MTAEQRPHTTWTWLVILLAVVVSGCDKKAREFAAQTAAILQQRSEQITRKIDAETKEYNATAVHVAQARRDLVDTSLRNERAARVRALAADYHEGRKPVSRWQTELAEYGRLDYEANRELLAAHVDATARAFQEIQGLSLERDRIDALARLLDALVEKPSLAREVEALTAFATEAQKEFDEKLCAQLEKQKTAGDKGAASAFEEKGCAQE